MDEIQMKTVIDCEKRAGLSTCPVCGHMAPDWCGESRDDVTPEEEEEMPRATARRKKKAAE